MPNNDISIYSAENAFTSENAAEMGRRGAVARWSLRGAMRRLAAMDWDDGEPITAERARFRLQPNGKCNSAELMAISRFMLAIMMNEHSEKSIAAFVEDVDGKLPNTNLNANANIGGDSLAAVMLAAEKRLAAQRIEEKKRHAANRED